MALNPKITAITAIILHTVGVQIGVQDSKLRFRASVQRLKDFGPSIPQGSYMGARLGYIPTIRFRYASVVSVIWSAGSLRLTVHDCGLWRHFRLVRPQHIRCVDRGISEQLPHVIQGPLKPPSSSPQT